MSEQHPWQWEDARWRSAVTAVRAGTSLAQQWPNGAKSVVAISFDSDHETPSLRDGNLSPAALSQGEFGARVGVPRILELLERHAVPATFFVPAVCALLRPDEVPRYIARGHEVGVHGWIHERNSLLARADELDLLTRALEVLTAQAGVRPTGIRTPSWDFSPDTLGVLRELGFSYDSSLMADDEPYELLEHGDPTGIVEIPVEWIRDDVPYFGMDRATALRPYTPPVAVGEIWRAEFDASYDAGGVFQLTMHPHVIGHRSRIAMLDALLTHIRSHSDVWITTHGDLARFTSNTTPKES